MSRIRSMDPPAPVNHLSPFLSAMKDPDSAASRANKLMLKPRALRDANIAPDAIVTDDFLISAFSDSDSHWFDRSPNRPSARADLAPAKSRAGRPTTGALRRSDPASVRAEIDTTAEIARMTAERLAKRDGPLPTADEVRKALFGASSKTAAKQAKSVDMATRLAAQGYDPARVHATAAALGFEPAETPKPKKAPPPSRDEEDGETSDEPNGFEKEDDMRDFSDLGEIVDVDYKGQKVPVRRIG